MILIQPVVGDGFGLLDKKFFDLFPADRNEHVRVDIGFGVLEVDEAFDGLGFKIPCGGVFLRGEIENSSEWNFLADEVQVVEVFAGGTGKQGVQFHEGDVFGGGEADFRGFDQRRDEWIAVAVEAHADVLHKIDQIPPS